MYNHLSLLVHLGYIFFMCLMGDSGTLPLSILVPSLVWQGSNLLYKLHLGAHVILFYSTFENKDDISI